MKEFAVLVHPGWSAHGRKNDGYDYTKYFDMLDNYKNGVVFLPNISDGIRKEIFLKSINDIVKYYYTGNTTTHLERHFVLDRLRLFLDSFENVVNKQVKYSYLKIKDVVYKRRISKWNESSILKLVLRKCYDGIVEKMTMFNAIFIGDMSCLPENKEINAEFIRRYSESKNIWICELGGIYLMEMFASKVYGSIIKSIGDINNVEIFGEFANQCVSSHQDTLKRVMGIDSKLIKNQSVYSICVNNNHWFKDDSELYMSNTTCCN